MEDSGILSTDNKLIPLAAKKLVADKYGFFALLHKDVLYVRNVNKQLKKPSWVKSCLKREDLGDNLVLNGISDLD